MSKFTRRKAALILGSMVLVGLVLLYANRAFVLTKLSLLLLYEDQPVKSDVIVALRGDWYYSRALKAGALFKQRFGTHIFISTALIDRSRYRLEKFGVNIKSEQERLHSIYMQLGIPSSQIIFDQQLPGGGTVGEIKRIGAMMLEHRFNSVLIVTSWWHTRRTKAICQHAFEKTDIEVRVVSAGGEIARANDWWRHRYEAVKIVEEFLKLFYFKFFSTNLRFKDDPPDSGLRASTGQPNH